MSRRLIVVRHAKAGAHVGPDHARELTASGHRAAQDVGRWLTRERLVPDYALISSATRTRQTWSGISHALGVDVHCEFADDLYHAGPEDVIDAIRWVPVDAEVVIYVGHNPTAGELPHLLDDGTGDRGLRSEIAYGYPTAATTVFDVAIAWNELSTGSARLLQLYTGDRT